IHQAIDHPVAKRIQFPELFVKKVEQFPVSSEMDRLNCHSHISSLFKFILWDEPASRLLSCARSNYGCISGWPPGWRAPTVPSRRISQLLYLADALQRCVAGRADSFSRVYQPYPGNFLPPCK